MPGHHDPLGGQDHDLGRLETAALWTVANDIEPWEPQALSQAYRYFIDNRDSAGKDRMDNVDDKHGIWRCHFAGSCSSVS